MSFPFLAGCLAGHSVVMVVVAAVAMTIVSTMYRLLARYPWIIAPDNGSEIKHLLFPNVAIKPAISSILIKSRELWNDGVYSAFLECRIVILVLTHMVRGLLVDYPQ